ncbi:MAG: BON domain-containing protein [Waddliaceae bacterium]
MKNFLFAMISLVPLVGNAAVFNGNMDDNRQLEIRVNEGRGIDNRYDRGYRRPMRVQQQRLDRYPEQRQYQAHPRQQIRLGNEDTREIVESILQAIEIEDGSDIRVSVQNGQVMIEGQVQSRQDLQRLQRAVNILENLRYQFRVSLDGQRQDQNDRYSSYQYCQNCGSNLIANVDNNHSKENVSDSAIKNEAQEKLKGGWFQSGYEQVVVEVNDGIVTLTGIVENKGDLGEIEGRIQGIKGVQLVKNHLNIKSDQNGRAASGRGLTDDMIRKNIEAELADTWWGSYDDVQIDVNNGVVIITGSVESEGDVQDVESKLSETPGVDVIRNRLKVKE